jgi:hypothetical protein
MLKNLSRNRRQAGNEGVGFRPETPAPEHANTTRTQTSSIRTGRSLSSWNVLCRSTKEAYSANSP